MAGQALGKDNSLPMCLGKRNHTFIIAAMPLSDFLRWGRTIILTLMPSLPTVVLQGFINSLQIYIKVENTVYYC